MPVTRFIDTNVWVYAHLEKQDDSRSAIAWELIHSSEATMISAQVVVEYFNVMRRNGVDVERICRNISVMLKRCILWPLDAESIHKTLTIQGHFGFSIWDSQIVSVALLSGCGVLYTEDLQHGQKIESLQLINPFLGSTDA